ncbi:unnamed protein product, partial [Urochloa humidicola]
MLKRLGLGALLSNLYYISRHVHFYFQILFLAPATRNKATLLVLEQTVAGMQALCVQLLCGDSGVVHLLCGDSGGIPPCGLPWVNQ